MSAGAGGGAKPPGDILQTIMRRRRQDAAEDKEKVPESTLRARMEAKYPTCLDLAAKFAASTALLAAAEFKRKSPSKGDIALHADIGRQVCGYADAGASVVSVLTEPTWFGGSLEDMEAARAALADRGEARPLVLRKDFLSTEYELLAARAYGADTALLIVAELSQEELERLLAAARALGMEPLVEVASEEEMERALAAGARVIGVNSRDLRTFQVDMAKTARLAAHARATNNVLFGTPTGPHIVALSGIRRREDVETMETGLEADGHRLGGILVGETLMRSPAPAAELRALLGLAPPPRRARVKVCGLQSPEDAVVAARAGASFVGIIFAPSPRTATVSQAQAVCAGIRSFRERGDDVIPLLDDVHRALAALAIAESPPPPDARATHWSGLTTALDAALDAVGPLLVGVFKDQPVDDVARVAAQLRLDAIQLHGTESSDYVRALRSTLEAEALHSLFADRTGGEEASEGGDEEREEREWSPLVLRVVHMPPADGRDEESLAAATAEQVLSAVRDQCLVLLDTKVGGTGGGTGVAFDWAAAQRVRARLGPVPFLIAGGLKPATAAEAVRASEAYGLDVSSGVETRPGVKDHEAVRTFLTNAKAAWSAAAPQEPVTKETTTKETTTAEEEEGKVHPDAETPRVWHPPASGRDDVAPKLLRDPTDDEARQTRIVPPPIHAPSPLPRGSPPRVSSVRFREGVTEGPTPKGVLRRTVSADAAVETPQRSKPPLPSQVWAERWSAAVDMVIGVNPWRTRLLAMALGLLAVLYMGTAVRSDTLALSLLAAIAVAVGLTDAAPLSRHARSALAVRIATDAGGAYDWLELKLGGAGRGIWIIALALALLAAAFHLLGKWAGGLLLLALALHFTFLAARNETPPKTD